MGHIILGAGLLLLAGFASLPAHASNAGVRNGGMIVETVRKTCECVRRHPSGFPYIEPRITECRTYKNAEGHVKALDCANCYVVCGDKPTS